MGPLPAGVFLQTARITLPGVFEPHELVYFSPRFEPTDIPRGQRSIGRPLSSDEGSSDNLHSADDDDDNDDDDDYHEEDSRKVVSNGRLVTVRVLLGGRRFRRNQAKPRKANQQQQVLSDTRSVEVESRDGLSSASSRSRSNGAERHVATCESPSMPKGTLVWVRTAYVNSRPEGGSDTTADPQIQRDISHILLRPSIRVSDGNDSVVPPRDTQTQTPVCWWPSIVVSSTIDNGNTVLRCYRLAWPDVDNAVTSVSALSTFAFQMKYLDFALSQQVTCNGDFQKALAAADSMRTMELASSSVELEVALSTSKSTTLSLPLSTSSESTDANARQDFAKYGRANGTPSDLSAVAVARLARLSSQ